MSVSDNCCVAEVGGQAWTSLYEGDAESWLVQRLVTLSSKSAFRKSRWFTYGYVLQIANQVTIAQFLELNTRSILQHPKVVAEQMVKNGVKLDIALQFVSNIKKIQREGKKS
jgi:hypothetical protein